MKINKITNSFVVFLILVSASLGLFFYKSSFANEIKQEYVFGEFLVKFKNDEKIYKLKTTDEVNIFSIIKEYQNKPEIEYIEPNFILKATAFPNDPDYRLQYYLNVIGAKDAWSKELLVREQERITRQSIIAILDTGIDLDHPDLKDKIWKNTKEVINGRDSDQNGYRDDVNGWDFVDNDADPNPAFSEGYNEEAVKHGTIVAGVAAAVSHNGQGISGMSWHSQIMSLRVLDSTGAGNVYSVIQAIDYAVDNGADIINMSFVGTGYSQSLANAIRNAYNKEILVVAAAGNTDPKINGINLDLSPSYPVCYDGSKVENMVIGVASVSQNLKKSKFSNFGDCIDLVAPGEGFYSTQAYQSNVSGFSNYYDGYWSGTSLSAPLVSGTLGLIKALRPGFSAEQIKNFVLNNTRDITNYDLDYKGELGSGLLDSAKALAAALGKKEPRPVSGEANNYIVAGLGIGSFPQLKVLKTDGSIFKSFYAYSPHFNGAINVAAGDVNGDGNDEIITGAGEGGGPHIRIFNIEGQVVSQFFAYEKDFRGGVNVAIGDIDNDGINEIITGKGKGGQPTVKVFDFQGNKKEEFFAYGENFFGGVKVAAGDVNGDGNDEIITGAGEGGGPHVRLFKADGTLISQFFAYNKYFKGGVNVAAGDLHGDGIAEIVVSVESNSVPTVRIFNYQGAMLNSFFAYEPNLLVGMNVAVGDIDNNGVSEILTGPSIGGSSLIKVFNLQGKLRYELLAHLQNYKGGARPAVISY